MRKLLGNIKPRKASGPDNIHAIFLKNCAKELSAMLAFVIQKSISTKAVPNNWRDARVTPILRKGARNQPLNYR